MVAFSLLTMCSSRRSALGITPNSRRHVAAMLVASCVSITGCASTLHKGPQFLPAAPPNSDQALVYFYRPSNPPLWRSPTLYVNDIRIGDLYNEAYTYVYFTPGTYSIRTDWPWDTRVPDLQREGSFEAGKTYFVRLGGDMSFSAGPAGSGTTVHISTSLQVLIDDQMKGEIAHCMFFTPERQQIP